MKGEMPAQIANPEAKKRWILKTGGVAIGTTFGNCNTIVFVERQIQDIGRTLPQTGFRPDGKRGRISEKTTNYLHYAVDSFIAGILCRMIPESSVTRYAMPKLYNLEQKLRFYQRAIKKRKEPKKRNRATGHA